MEYLVGILLAMATVVFAAVVGLNRERSFFSTVAFVVATYYVLFALMGASHRTLMVEIAIAIGFFVIAAIGFKGNFWLVAVALIGHGIFDSVRSGLISNPAFRAGGQVSAWHSMWSLAGGWRYCCCEEETFRIPGPWIVAPASFSQKAAAYSSEKH